jgi:prepilin-type N-terminal cleavage/methylation domain-containing protein
MYSNRGFTLIEAVVAMTIFSIGIILAVQMVFSARRLSDESKDTVQAANYLEEGLEAVRSVRNAAWTNVGTDGTYALQAITGGTTPWSLVANGSETIGKYSRSIKIESVRRDDTDGSGTLTASDNITTGTGTFDDPDTKKITATVTWQQGRRTVNRTVSTYLTNWQQ